MGGNSPLSENRGAVDASPGVHRVPSLVVLRARHGGFVCVICR
jgi:hypothetical protein